MEISRRQVGVILGGVYLVSHLQAVEPQLPESVLLLRAPLDGAIQVGAHAVITLLQGDNLIRNVKANDTTKVEKQTSTSESDISSHDLSRTRDQVIVRNLTLWVAKLNDPSITSIDEYLENHDDKISAQLIIKAGEKFNFNGLYGGYTTVGGQGYEVGPSASGGRIDGAGVCQAATTVYIEMQKHSLEPDQKIAPHPAMTEVISPNGVYVTIEDNRDGNPDNDKQNLVWTNDTGKDFILKYEYDSSTNLLDVSSVLQ